MRHQRGFTLVELLVSVSLLAIIMVALGSAMRTMAQTESRVDQRLSRMDDMRVVSGFLRQTLGRVSGQKWPNPQGQGGQVVAFRATPSSVEWVGIMPARHGVGGRHFFRLQAETLGQRHALVLRFLPWSVTDQGFPDWSQAPHRELVPGVSALVVNAQGLPPQLAAPPPGWPMDWVSGWPLPEHLPERLSLSWADESGVWPELVLPLRELTQGRGVGGGFTIGGSR